MLGPDLVRQYSLCGDPADRSRYRIGVLREPAGRGGSAHVHDHLHPGDEVCVRGPRNHFELVPAPRYVFVAGGIGVTPILPMAAAARAAGTPHELHYGGRSRRSMAFLEELEGHVLHPQDEVGLLDLDAVLGDLARARWSTAAAPSRCWPRSRSGSRPRCCTWSGSAPRTSASPC